MWTQHGLLVLLASGLTLISARLGIAPPLGGKSTHLRRQIGTDDVIRGVNLGGWLLTEEWITPSIYTNDAADEYHLCAELGKKKCLSRLEDHWKSFFTRDDFEEIKAAGLNSVRIPIGYWAVDLRDDEPYVSGQYPYLIQAVNWASEHGLSVLLDLHGAPGSQNGQDNSGLIGPVLFSSNSSNLDRSINVLKNLTEEFTKEIYGNTVIGVELLNEPRLTNGFSMAQLKDFYSDAAEVISGVDGDLGIVMHDAFWGPKYWANYDPLSNTTSTSSTPSDQFILDTHQYYAFEPLNNLPHDIILEKVCNISQLLKNTDLGLLPTVVGEWSLETGHSPNSSSSVQNRYDSREKRTWFRLFFEAQLAAYTPSNAGNQPSRGWYYWTWKTDYDIDTWSYRRGLAQGYIPSDVSNSSTLVFPLLENGCVDSSFNYTAPRNPGSGGIRYSPDVVSIVSVVLVSLGLLVCSV